MNQQQRAVVQQTLEMANATLHEALEHIAKLKEENAALRQLLEQPEPVQEPVAWYRDEDGMRIYYDTKCWEDATPLYTTPPAQPEPVQEPDWLDKKAIEPDWSHVWLLIKAASYASSRGHLSGTTNWGAAMSAYLRHETPPAQPAVPTQCWKCGDMDAMGHAKCDVPACGMREKNTALDKMAGNARELGLNYDNKAALISKDQIIRLMAEAGLKPPARGDFIFIHWDQIALLLAHEREAIERAVGVAMLGADHELFKQVLKTIRARGNHA
jgi:hypothetical protein